MEFSTSRITKLDAANRQLDQAISLFFEKGDMLAIHTLTGAAFQLFADLGKLDGVVSRYRSEELIRRGRMRDWIQALNSTQNFLKHADRDPNEEHVYVEEGTILFLFEAVELAQRVAPLPGGARQAFQLWFISSYPEMIEPAVRDKLRAVDTFGIDQTDRHLWAELLRRRRER